MALSAASAVFGSGGFAPRARNFASGPVGRVGMIFERSALGYGFGLIGKLK